MGPVWCVGTPSSGCVGTWFLEGFLPILSGSFGWDHSKSQLFGRTWKRTAETMTARYIQIASNLLNQKRQINNGNFLQAHCKIILRPNRRESCLETKNILYWSPLPASEKPPPLPAGHAGAMLRCNSYNLRPRRYISYWAVIGSKTKNIVPSWRCIIPPNAL